MLKFNDFINEAKKKETDECWPAQAGKAKMSEADVDESGLRMAAHAAHKEGKKEFEFQGKTYPVKVQKEEVELDEAHTKNQLKQAAIAHDIKHSHAAAAGEWRKATKHYKASELAKKMAKEEVQIDESIPKTGWKVNKQLTANMDAPKHKDNKAYTTSASAQHSAFIHKSHDDDKWHVQIGTSDGKTHYKAFDSYEKAKAHLHGKTGITEEVEINEGKMKELAYDLDNMSHDEFHKHYGHPKSHFDPKNFKKPVQKGHEMERARALAQRGMQSLSKEEVERIEEKLTQLDELSKKTLGNYVKKASSDLASSIHSERDAEENDDAPEASEHGRRASNRMSGLERAGKKIAKEEVEKGHEMDRAKALAHRGMMSVKEEAALIAELSKKTLSSYAQKAMKDSDQRKDDWSHEDHAPYEDEDDNETEKGRDTRKIENRDKGVKTAIKKLAKEEVELEEATTRKDFQMVADLIKGHESAEKRKELAHHHAEIFKKQNPRFDHAKFMKAAGVNEGEMCEDEMRFPKDGWSQNDSMAKPVKSSDAMKQHSHYFNKVTKLDPKTGNPVKEEVSQEMSPYLKATLEVMDEGKIDDLRDAQKLRQASQSAYDKNFKPDTSHPHIQVVKGTAYGGENQKDDEHDEKPEAEKKGRGRPSGSKSGARLKGGGHEDGGIPVHNLHLPKSHK